VSGRGERSESLPFYDHFLLCLPRTVKGGGKRLKGREKKKKVTQSKNQVGKKKKRNFREQCKQSTRGKETLTR